MRKKTGPWTASNWSANAPSAFDAAVASGVLRRRSVLHASTCRLTAALRLPAITSLPLIVSIVSALSPFASLSRQRRAHLLHRHVGPCLARCERGVDVRRLPLVVRALAERLRIAH